MCKNEYTVSSMVGQGNSDSIIRFFLSYAIIHLLYSIRSVCGSKYVNYTSPIAVYLYKLCFHTCKLYSSHELYPSPPLQADFTYQ